MSLSGPARPVERDRTGESVAIDRRAGIDVRVEDNQVHTPRPFGAIIATILKYLGNAAFAPSVTPSKDGAQGRQSVPVRVALGPVFRRDDEFKGRGDEFKASQSAIIRASMTRMMCDHCVEHAIRIAIVRRFSS
jgi:hypothetical protein